MHLLQQCGIPITICVNVYFNVVEAHATAANLGSKYSEQFV